jgi:hypothetical protein
LGRTAERRRVIEMMISADVTKNRGERRWTFPVDLGGARLFGAAIAQAIEFSADTFFALGS